MSGSTWYADLVARVRLYAAQTSNHELVQACDAVGPLEGQLAYTAARRALQAAVMGLCSPTATGTERDAVVTAANEVHLSLCYYRANRRHARRLVAAAIRELDARDRVERAGAAGVAGAADRPVILAQVTGAGRVSLSLVLVEDAWAPRVIETLSTLLHRVGVPQEIGDVADEITCLTTGDASVALAELGRLCGEHGLELRAVPGSGAL